MYKRQAHDPYAENSGENGAAIGGRIDGQAKDAAAGTFGHHLDKGRMNQHGTDQGTECGSGIEFFGGKEADIDREEIIGGIGGQFFRL